jgi:hypothetical protein
MNIRLLVLASLSLAMGYITGCKKTDDSPPIIKVLSPSAGSTCNIPCSINIKAEVSDDMTLTEVSAELLTPALLPTGVSTTVRPDAREYLLETVLQAADIHLESGTYFLKISARDEINKSSEFIEIHVNEFPKQFQKTFIVVESGGSISLIDYTGTTQNIITSQTGTFTSAGMDSRWRTIYITGTDPGLITILDLDDYNIIRTITAPDASPVSDLSTGFLDTDNGKFWQLRGADELLGITRESNQNQILLALTGNHVVRYFALSETYFFSMQETQVLTGKSLVTHYKNSGSFKTQLPFNGTAKGCITLSDSEFLIAVNNGSTGELSLYNANNNTLTSLISMLPLIEKIEFSGNSNEILCYTATDVRKVNTSSASTQIVLSSPAQHLIFEPVASQYYILDNSNLYIADQNMVLLETKPVSNGKRLLLQWNK